jgi:hypothetical protein
MSINCRTHGLQQETMVCQHILAGLAERRRVGFYLYQTQTIDVTGLLRRKSLMHNSPEPLMLDQRNFLCGNLRRKAHDACNL